jgi:thiamine biosynthesis protein ThiI
MKTSDYAGKGVVLRFGELFLKGRNRFLFEQALERNVRRALKGRSDLVVHRDHGRIFVLGADDADLVDRLSEVFGLSSVSPACFCGKDLEAISRIAVAFAESRPPEVKSFRISARRADKKFGHTSSEIGRIVGSAVVLKTGLKVDLEDYDMAIGVEIGFDWTFVWSKQKKGGGGLPVGTSGKAMLLLSGGIDSPVAGHLMQKRGMELDAVYFHSFPYTGDGAKDKVTKLATILSGRQRNLKLHVVPFTEMQEYLRDNAQPGYLVILYRRAMIRIAEIIARQRGIQVLVTGESLGQVASQTAINLGVIQQAGTLPIFRPLIGFDKVETIDLARRIGTYDISITPHDDCCSLFVPKHPQTKASLRVAQAIEEKIDWQPIVETAALNTTVIEL